MNQIGDTSNCRKRVHKWLYSQSIWTLKNILSIQNEESKKLLSMILQSFQVPSEIWGAGIRRSLNGDSLTYGRKPSWSDNKAAKSGMADLIEKSLLVNRLGDNLLTVKIEQVNALIEALQVLSDENAFIYQKINPKELKIQYDRSVWFTSSKTYTFAEWIAFFFQMEIIDAYNESKKVHTDNSYKFSKYFLPKQEVILKSIKKYFLDFAIKGGRKRADRHQISSLVEVYWQKFVKNTKDPSVQLYYRVFEYEWNSIISCQDAVYERFLTKAVRKAYEQYEQQMIQIEIKQIQALEEVKPKKKRNKKKRKHSQKSHQLDQIEKENKMAQEGQKGQKIPTKQENPEKQSNKQIIHLSAIQANAHPKRDKSVFQKEWKTKQLECKKETLTVSSQNNSGQKQNSEQAPEQDGPKLQVSEQLTKILVGGVGMVVKQVKYVEKIQIQVRAKEGNPGDQRQNDSVWSQEQTKKKVNQYLHFYIECLQQESGAFKPHREAVMKALNQAISEVDIKLKWQLVLFGSCASGFDLKESDIDLILLVNDLDITLYEVEIVLRDKPWIIDCTYIEATVPILKFGVDLKTYSGKILGQRQLKKCPTFKVDLLLGNRNKKQSGIESTKFIASVFHEHKEIKHTCYLLKQLLKQKDLNVPYQGGISSYVLVNLVYGVLKMKNSLKQPFIDQLIIVAEFMAEQFFARKTLIRTVTFEKHMAIDPYKDLNIEDPLGKGLIKTSAYRVSSFIYFLAKLKRTLLNLLQSVRLIPAKQGKKIKKLVFDTVQAFLEKQEPVKYFN